MKPGYSQFFQLNDIHGCVIKTKPTEHFRGSGEYKMDEVGLIHSIQKEVSNFWKATPFLRSLKHSYYSEAVHLSEIPALCIELCNGPHTL